MTKISYLILHHVSACVVEAGYCVTNTFLDTVTVVHKAGWLFLGGYLLHQSIKSCPSFFPSSLLSPHHQSATCC